MKRIVLVPFMLFVIVVPLIAQTQIPNNGFENWTTSGNCLQAKGWACINDWLGSTENCYSISRSSDHYPASIGSYSIKIENRVLLFPDAGAFGMVWSGDSTGFGANNPAFHISGHPTSLCGYFKFIPENHDTMDIHFALYNKGVEVTGGRLISKTSVPEWSSFVIPVSDPEYADADSARIMMSSFYADNFAVHGNSVLYVDNLSFDNLISSVADQPAGNRTFCLFPDPANNFIRLNFAGLANHHFLLNIFSSSGRLVRTETLNHDQEELSIADLSEGLYIVKLVSDKKNTISKLIILR